MNIEELVLLKNTITQPTMTEILIRMMQDQEFCFDAPYQRDYNIWKPKMKRNLIESILAGLPIGSIHVVLTDEQINMNVLDAKQRLTTIREFIENKFDITWKGNKYYYKDLLKNTEMRNDFRNYVFQLVQWKPMGVLKARDIFNRINAMSSLNQNEKIYCNHFFTKVLLIFVWNECMKDLKMHLRDQIKNNKRYGGLRWLHQLLYFCFGEDLSGCYHIKKNFKIKDLENSANKIDEKILNVIGESNLSSSKKDNELISIDIIKSLDFYQNYLLFNKVCTKVKDCLEYNNPFGKLIPSVDMTDIIIFFISKIQDKVLTLAMIEENKKGFQQLISKFVETKKEFDLNSFSNHTDRLSARRNVLEVLLNLMDLDLGIKSDYISDDEKMVCLMKSKNTCPSCGTVLTLHNVQFDHYNPKSLCSASELRLLCKSCNLKKNNMTIDSLNKLF